MAKSLSPKVFFPIFSIKFQKFDSSSSQVQPYTFPGPALDFLWAAFKKVVSPIVIAPDSSTERMNQEIWLHFAYIQDAQNITVPPSYPVPPHYLGFRRLLNANYFGKCKMITAKKTLKNGWEKLLDLVQDMILKLIDSLPLGSPESNLKFLKQSKALGVVTVISIYIPSGLPS